jgi:hypothetical protein
MPPGAGIVVAMVYALASLPGSVADTAERIRYPVNVAPTLGPESPAATEGTETVKVTFPGGHCAHESTTTGVGRRTNWWGSVE